MTTGGVVTGSATLPASMVGRRVPRKEDARLLRGRGRFGDDVSRPRMTHARVVRASVARGRIRSIDTSVARELPGVVEVVTGADLPGQPVIPVRLSVQGIDLTEHLQPVLPASWSGDEVRYVGQPVAVVLAEDPYVAEDAAELVEIDYDTSALVGDVVLDVGDLADREEADVSGPTVIADFMMGFGDADEAFAAADHTTSMIFRIGRHSAVPMEPRTLVVDPSHGLEIFGATKVPAFNRRVLADLLGIDEAGIRMHAVDAGGGFGVRGEFYPEDFLIPWLALRTERPVSWCEDRAEHMVAVNHSREQTHRLHLALRADGTILGLRSDVVADNGAYVRTHGIIVPELTTAMLPGPYRIPAFSGRTRVALTNKTPCGTYRAPGRFEGTASRESLLDQAASELRIDRIELRRRNLLRSDELPHTRPISTLGTEMVLDKGDFAGLFERALDRTQELGWFARRDSGRAAGRRLGVGVAMFMEKSGLGPHETADVELTRSGRVRVYSGGTSLGQGIETVLAQVVADVLPVGLAAIDVVAGDTAEQPYGTGSWASRSTVLAGNAVRGAAIDVSEAVLDLAARVLDRSPEDLLLDDGCVRTRSGDLELPLARVAEAAEPGSPQLRADEPAGLRRRHRFTVEHMTYPYGAHVTLVEVHPGTGQVEVLRYLVAYEVGVAVNPTLVEGQLKGGIAQGIGGALLEEFRYDETGQPQSTTFMDYLLPTAAEIPDLDVLVSTDHPATTNPLGVRGAGEGGLTGAGAALAAAVRDALGGGPDAAITRLPVTPQRIVALLAAQAGSSAPDLR